MNVIACLTIACFIPNVKGNLLLNKPSKQSSTHEQYHAFYANDGDPSTYSFTSYGFSYWQGDLQGYYVINSIAVTSYQPYAGYIENAYIGVSVNDVTSPNNEVIICGQWPQQNIGTTFIYYCNHTQPVRFVRVYIDHQDFLNIAEIAAQGLPTTALKGMTFERMISEVVSSYNSTLTTEDSRECANACFYGQPCLAFSFSDTASPNCLLASNVSTTSSTDWSTYKVMDDSVTVC